MGSSRCAELLGRGRENAVFGGSSRCAGLLDQRKEEAASFDGDLPLHGAAGMGEAAFWGAPAARGCSIKGRGCFMARGSSAAALRGAAGMGEEGGYFWGELPLRGLLDWGREDAAFGGAPAARSCWDGGGRRLLFGGGGGGGGLPMRGAARLREGGGCFGGSSRCVGLLDSKEEAAPSWGDPAARGCSTERGRNKLL